MLPLLLKAGREDHDSAASSGREGLFGERPGTHEPLGHEPRLDDVARALAAPDEHLVRLRRREVAGGLELGDDALPGLVTIEAGKGAAA